MHSFSSNRNCSEEQLQLLNQMFEEGSSKRLFESLEQIHKEIEREYTEESAYVFMNNYSITMALVFEYAIHSKAHSFIVDLLSSDGKCQWLEIYNNFGLKDVEPVRFICSETFITYASFQDHDFQRKALRAMVNYPSNEIAISDKFRIEMASLYQQVIANGKAINSELDLNIGYTLSDCVFRFVSILSDDYVNTTDRSYYLSQWVRGLFVQLNSNPTPIEKTIIIDTFFNLLPKNQDCLEYLLNFLVNEVCNKQSEIDNIKDIIHEFLVRTLLKTEHIIEVINSLNSATIVFTPVLINFLSPSHTMFPVYQLIVELLNTKDNDDVFNMIISNETNAARISIPDNFKISILARLDFTIREQLAKYYIENNSDFSWAEFLSYYLDEWSEATILDYLKNSHTIIDEKFLSHLLNDLTKIQDKKIAVKLLLDHPNHTLTHIELFSPLYTFMKKGHVEINQILLQDNNVFKLLKEYELLNGDLQFSNEDHGKFLASVIAWYLLNSSQEKSEELYFSFTSNFRKNLETKFIMPSISFEQYSLKTLIILKGSIKMINSVGGINPRLLKIEPNIGSPQFFMPEPWKKSRLTVLREYQKKFIIRYADTESSKFIKSTNPILSQHAYALAKLYFKTPLTLQHQTRYQNATAIIQEGALLKREKLENSIGKSSNGLTAKKCYKFLFNFFTHTLNDKNNSHKITMFGTHEHARFLFDIPQFLHENKHIDFIIIGLYPHLEPRQFQLENGLIFDANPEKEQELITLRKISLTSNNQLFEIYTELFQLVLEKFIFIKPLEEQTLLLQKLYTPITPEDKSFAANLLSLLPLEWLIPGDIPLKLSYVTSIRMGNKIFDFTQLSKVVKNGTEKQVLQSISNFVNIEQFPFILHDILIAAVEKKYKTVVEKIITLQSQKKPTFKLSYLPKTVYQIESLTQLILEDLSNERVYVHYQNNELLINSELIENSNRHGAHHAEMSKLYYALGIGNLENQNALAIRLPNQLNIQVGLDKQHTTLMDVRDRLLTFEITSLLVSYQNKVYYETNKGLLHPITGKGATNGRVALLPKRLFDANGSYTINTTVENNDRKIKITSSNIENLESIAHAITSLLGLNKQLCEVSPDFISINCCPEDFIAKMRQHAIFYEGINVITLDGRLLLAERRGKGLASAGGHHSDKYTNNISHGLKSEFGLVFKNPEEALSSVTQIVCNSSLTKTGNYLLSADFVEATQSAQLYGQRQQMPFAFRADSEEFEPSSEQALTLMEMRHLQFYDVMPLEEIAQYQLDVFKKFLKGNFPDDYPHLEIRIDTSVEKTALRKIPKASFGQISISTPMILTEELETVLENSTKATEGNRIVYKIEDSPYALIHALKELKKLQLDRCFP